MAQSSRRPSPGSTPAQTGIKRACKSCCMRQMLERGKEQAEAKAVAWADVPSIASTHRNMAAAIAHELEFMGYCKGECDLPEEE